jgi:hypothetical protein
VDRLEDGHVPYLATELQARTLGIPLLDPAAREVPALEKSSVDVDGSALSQFDFGLEAPLPGTYADPPTVETTPHEGIRRLPEAIAQIDVFLATGVMKVR